jgi:Integrase core domain
MFYITVDYLTCQYPPFLAPIRPILFSVFNLLMARSTVLSVTSKAVAISGIVINHFNDFSRHFHRTFSYHRIMENAVCRKFEFMDLKEAQDTLNRFKDFYNLKRIHSGIGYKSPYKYFFKK